MAGFALATKPTEIGAEPSLRSVKARIISTPNALENVENKPAEENCIVTADSSPRLRARCKIPALLGALMHDLDYVVELAKAYRRGEITRDELQDKIHSCSLKAVEFGVIIFSEDYGDEATADFVVAAGLPIFYERVKPGPPAPDFTIIQDDDEEPPGYSYVDKGDERVKDFPPE